MIFVQNLMARAAPLVTTTRPEGFIGEESEEVAAMSREPALAAGDDVDSWSGPEGGAPLPPPPEGVALLPKRAHAFFHLHWVHQRSRCSNP